MPGADPVAMARSTPAAPTIRSAARDGAAFGRTAAPAAARGDAHDDAAARSEEARGQPEEAGAPQGQAARPSSTGGGASSPRPSAAGQGQAARWAGERREAGPDRGMGVFALEAVPKGDVVASAPPALSCIFDAAADTVCSFCFDQPGSRAVTEREVTLTTSEPDENNNRSFGLKLDDHTPPGATVPVTIVTMVLHTSPNRDAVRVGDRLLSVNGKAVTAGQESAVPLLIEAAKAGGEAKCVFARPALICCPGCKRTSACDKCVGLGRLKWHAYECGLCRAMPEKAMQGETATLRMLLRYKVSTDARIGEWSAALPAATRRRGGPAAPKQPEKEPISLLTSLQANACDLPPEQLQMLSKLSGVLRRVGRRCPHLPGAHQRLPDHARRPQGRLRAVGAHGVAQPRLRAQRAVGDRRGRLRDDPRAARHRRGRGGHDLVRRPLAWLRGAPQDVLQTHYGFECRCGRCVAEQRKELKARMKERDHYLAAPRR